MRSGGTIGIKWYVSRSREGRGLSVFKREPRYRDCRPEVVVNVKGKEPETRTTLKGTG